MPDYLYAWSNVTQPLQSRTDCRRPVCTCLGQIAAEVQMRYKRAFCCPLTAAMTKGGYKIPVIIRNYMYKKSIFACT